MGRFTGVGRLCTVNTPLGKDVLLMERMTAREEISGLFRFDLELISQDGSIAFDSMIGQPITVEMKLDPGACRFFNGMVSRFSQGVSDRRFVAYRAELVPWLWFLGQRADCRIFQEKTVPEILREVFESAGFTDFEDKLQGSYPQRNYCVQYRETDLNFARRLMEEEGIGYYFRHEADCHILVLFDSPSAHSVCAEQPDVEYASDSAERRAGEIERLVREEGFAPGRYAVEDYNFERPSEDLLTSTNTVRPIGGNSSYEIYDYPGEYGERSEGDRVARLRMEAEEAAAVAIDATSEIGAFCPGYRFRLKNHYRSDFNGEYVLTQVEHVVSQGVLEEHGAQYANSFRCIPYSVPFRPLQTTPKPTVHGVQTAVVVGPSGEEIYVDKHGRVKVQFHWDREGRRDEKSSCWIRVSQPWAGKEWGMIHHPRIGQEVIVDFLEGDPDRPIIVGRVYNGDQVTPYELPAHATRSAVKSQSSKGGTVKNFNEIRFEDKAGSEQLFVHAEKDMDRRVKNDLREYVGNQSSLIVAADQLEAVRGDKHGTVDGHRKEKIGGSLATRIGGSHDEKTGQKYALDAGEEIHLKAGMKLVIEAGMQVSIKGPGGFIDIGPAGIAISGTMVQINSGGAAASGSGASPGAPGEPDEADDGTTGTKLN